jgi:hypothetical protein
MGFSVAYYLLTSISLLSTISQVIVITLSKLYNRLVFEILLMFFISSTIYSIGLLINFNEDPNIEINDDYKVSNLCETQSLLIVFFELSQYIWCTIITHSIYYNVVLQTANNNFNKLVYYLCGFLIPLAFLLLSIFSSSIGPAGYYCWLKTGYKPVLPSFILSLEIIYYCIVWIMILYSIFLCVKVISYIKKEISKYKKNEQDIKNYYTYKRTLLFYSFSPLIILVPFTVLRTIDYFANITNDFMNKFGACLICSQGIILSICYGLNQDIKDAFTQTFKCIFCCNKEFLRVSKSGSSRSASTEGREFSNFNNRFNTLGSTFIDENGSDIFLRNSDGIDTRTSDVENSNTEFLIRNSDEDKTQRKLEEFISNSNSKVEKKQFNNLSNLKNNDKDFNSNHTQFNSNINNEEKHNKLDNNKSNNSKVKKTYSEIIEGLKRQTLTDNKAVFSKRSSNKSSSSINEVNET